MFEDVWTFDGTTWTEIAAGQGPGPRVRHGLVATATELRLFGGISSWQPSTVFPTETWALR